MVIGECVDSHRMRNSRFHVTSWQQHMATVNIENTPAPRVNVFRNYYTKKRNTPNIQYPMQKVYFLIQTL
ncbi:hypothetical protein C0J52_11071 [Blattella germanica]|nr:hypothetical protein C0J52_11071 [Blattella germanica]